VTVLLARNRQPPLTVGAGVPHAELAAELLSLPSGLLVMVCEAIVKLKVRLGAVYASDLGQSFGCVAHRRGPTRSRREPGACQSRVGAVLTSRVSPTMMECWQYCEYSSTALQVSDVAKAGRDSQRTGPSRRSSRLSTLRAGGSA
jgi:hypothetical protein